MSDDGPYTVPPMIRQQQLVQEITPLLRDEISDNWVSFEFKVNTLIGYKEGLIYARLPSGEVVHEFPPYAIVKKINELRSVMYRPGAGTWFSMTLSVDQSGGVSTDFNYDQEPPWDTPANGVLYAQDFEKFPRDEEATPEWLRQRLIEASSS